MTERDAMPGDDDVVRPDGRRPLLTLAGFAAAYVVAAFIGRATTFEGTPFALIWPAAGVAVLWFLIRGVGLASVDSVVLAVCAFATNAATGVSLDQSVVLAVTNLIQTWVAVVLLRRWCGELWGCGGTRALDSPRTTIRYVAALAGGMVAGVAVGAVGTFIVQNELTSTRYLLWFDRNFCGAVAVTTLGLLVGQRIASKNRRPLVPGGRAEWVEIAAATVADGGDLHPRVLPRQRPDGVPAAGRDRLGGGPVRDAAQRAALVRRRARPRSC